MYDRVRLSADLSKLYLKDYSSDRFQTLYIDSAESEDMERRSFY